MIIVDGFQPYYTINDNKNEDENQIKITMQIDLGTDMDTNIVNVKSVSV